MKTLVMLLVILVFTAGLAYGQAGYIGLFSDEYGSECELIDAIPGLASVYVIHMATAGATASQWKVQSGGGFTMVYMSESLLPYPCVDCGNTQEGIYVPYGSCLSSPLFLITINYFAQGTSAPCSYLEVVPDPDTGTGEIVVWDCGDEMLAGGGARLYVNPDGSCECGPVPTEQTNWGKMKALYTE